MASISFFPPEVVERVGNYVYRLIDPRNGETFYVGRGKGNRVFDHARGIAGFQGEEELSEKLDRILEIRNAGLDVIHVIHRHGIPKEALSHVEAALIDAYPGLTNESGGEGSAQYGPMHVEEIVRKYIAPEMETEPEERIILININKIVDRSSREAIYEQVKGNWRINAVRAEKAQYVIAVYRGLAIGVFRIVKWHESSEHPGRFWFEHCEVPEAVWERFVGSGGKRVSNENMKHIRFPVRYWNC